MIAFRAMNDDIPCYWEPDIHWQVEWYPDDVEAGAPYGLAWVSASAGDGGFAYLDFVLVRDDHRRQGVATDLVRACRERWPGLKMDAVSDAGEAFLASLEGRKSP